MTNNVYPTVAASRSAPVAVRFLVAMAMFACASSVLASPQCTTEPAAKWAPIDGLRKKLGELGYKIEVLKVTKGSCYELYGRDRDGRRVEIYYHPISLEIVRATTR